jgi:2,4-dienoyl-CoA reductase-like NADH-dependent reductase (Old Yellow Enzyme family)/thioredoxin reductase
VSYEHLLEPITVRGLTLRNRVLLPGMATIYVDEKGHVTQRLIDYHVARARGGSGLNITEACSVHTPSAPPYFLSIHNDEFVPGLAQLTSAIHAAGGKAGVQLWQGGLITAFLDPNAVCVFPSAQMGPPAASIELIHECERAFGEAAARAVRAGFDCVEFHCAHNYSPHSFLSAAFNQRTDEYGGSFENRMRYPLECLRAIRRSIPGSMPVLIRVSAIDDFLPGGMTIEDMIEFLKRAREVGADIVDVSRGNVVSPAIIYEVPPIDIPRGFNVENAAAIRKGTGMVTCAVGRINDPDQAEEILASGKADMVAIGRGQIADPEFVNKVMAGRAADIAKCVACDQGCYDRVTLPDRPGISCLQNPSAGREREFVVTKATRPKTVLIAGGGMGGMEAAALLHERGHRPILCEASGALGGQFVLAGMAPRKDEMREATLARADQLKRAGVDIRLKTRVDAALIEKIKPDAVIIAVGGEPIRFKVPGIDGPNVTDSVAVLTGNSKVKGQVAVIGGGLVGLEVAEYLAEKQPGVTGVTVVEMLDSCGEGLGMLRKQSMDENLAKEQVCTMTGTRCVAIRPDAVVAECGGEQKEIPADYVVIAVGSRSVDHAALDAACERLGIPFYVIGDAKQARRAIDATAEGANAVLAIHNS